MKNILALNANLSNNLSVSFDRTYKRKDNKYTNIGDLISAEVKFNNILENSYSNKKIKNLSFIKSKIISEFNIEKKSIKIDGKYSINNGDFLDFNLHGLSHNNSKISELKIKGKYNDEIKLDLINFYKKKDKIADLTIDLTKSKDKLKIKKLELSDKKNKIIVKGLNFYKEKFNSLDEIFVKNN